MVNEYRQQILELLKEGDTHSGQTLAEHLGISRVAVWKNIKKLQEYGYTINSTASGYTLTAESDQPIPEAFGSSGKNITYLSNTESTMIEARKAAFNECSAGTLYIAETQSKGQGRKKHSWLSEKGGLYFTLVTRPKAAPVNAFSQSLTAAGCLCKILQEKYNIEAQFKWPNDIYVENKKIVGILEEYFVYGDRIEFVNLGIGINVHNNPDLKSAVSLDSICGRELSRKNLLQDFLLEFTKESETAEQNSGIWNKYSFFKNRTITGIKSNGDSVTGKAETIHADGSLLLALANGGSDSLDFGNEITFIEGKGDLYG